MPVLRRVRRGRNRRRARDLRRDGQARLDPRPRLAQPGARMSWEQRLDQLIGRPENGVYRADKADKADGTDRTDKADPLAQERWARVEQVFAAALSAGDEAESVIARECGDDAALADEVRSLLAAHRRSGAADRVARELGRSEERRVGKECRSRWSP